MKKMFLSVVCLMLAGMIAGCGTIKGIGEDVKAVGGWMTKSSERVQEGK